MHAHTSRAVETHAHKYNSHTHDSSMPYMTCVIDSELTIHM
jgi:hypothetical protein